MGVFPTTTRCRRRCNRRFDNGLMFTAFYVWSKSLSIDSHDCTFGRQRRPNGGSVGDQDHVGVDYSYAD